MADRTSLGIGLAGLGVHGLRYARHLLAGDVPGAHLAGISRANTPTGAAFAKEHGVAFAPTPEELVEHHQVEAIVLCLPPSLHAEAAAAAVSAGRPTLVEKPLAADAASARRVAAAVADSGTPLMMAHTLRFDSIVGRLRDERDTLGRLRMVALNQRFEPSDRPWIDTPGCGGMLLNTGIHEFDLLRYLTEREAIRVSAATSRSHTQETEDGFVATVELEGGILATVDATRASASRSGRMELIGDKAQLWGDHIHRTLARVSGRDREELGPVPPIATLPPTLAAFVACARGETESPITVDDGVAAVELVEACQRAASARRTVELKELRAMLRPTDD